MDWSFNLKTMAWYYDPSSVSLSPADEDDITPTHNRPTPLLQARLPRLNVNEILAFFEENFGNCLFVTASTGGRWISELSHFAQHNLLTFGAVVDYHQAGVVARLPSTPAPEWVCKSLNPDVKANYSTSGTSNPQP